jgi:hypothetical protein
VDSLGDLDGVAGVEVDLGLGALFEVDHACAAVRLSGLGVRGGGFGNGRNGDSAGQCCDGLALRGELFEGVPDGQHGRSAGRMCADGLRVEFPTGLASGGKN